MTRDAQYYSRGEAANYDALIGAQRSLLPVLRKLADPSGKRIADLGAGTGRLTLQVLPVAASVAAVDTSEQMLDRLREKAGLQPEGKLKLAVADHAGTGLDSCAYDLILGGWSICYGVAPSQPGWEQRLAAIESEMNRIGIPGGDVVLFENYGTAAEEPAPPEHLLAYFRSLEERYEFKRTVVRVDYRFADVREAAARTGAFFGPETAEKVRRNGWSIVPEFAGVWHRKLE
ncbi:hypothetical protein VE23_01925 [Paenibacillus sp. D9]|uniref:class I SAM-dependent methyltransferase n=1 Tax=Paenibacillus sp. D9 TaxID=665792 RepID=UPI00061E6C2D|nr:methyltransferase domain-containing protein [Paenibacillus sp. D9]KKC46138.1 hypothetical protein VE23_01925 [Paenibacillus sp. D9]